MQRSKRLNRRMLRHRALMTHFHLGLNAYDAGDLKQVQRHRAAIGMLPEGGSASLEFMALDWRARWLEDRHEEALAVAEAITRSFPDDPDGVLELAHILSDMERPREALAVLLDGTGKHEEDADLWYELGLVSEGLEEWDIRKQAFQAVWQLEHELEPIQRLYLSEDRFIETVEETIERLPPVARRALGNVAIIVEDYPEAWIIDEDVADPRILGLFDGPDRATEQSIDAVLDGPARIYLYRWNIERSCATEEEAIEQVEITVLHEVGHYLGLDEEALHFIGLG